MLYNIYMNNIDYNRLMEEIIKKEKNRPKLLLHACCAPCSTSVLNRLSDFFDITLYFYNPNMDTKEEYYKRGEELECLVEKLNLENANRIKVVCEDYNHQDFLNIVNGREEDREGGNRCYNCFVLRLSKTCMFAKQNGFNYFTTTLSVSPYKNSKVLNEIGEKLEKEFGIKYLYSDFKKKEGYKLSIELSKKYNLYRQNYCGCEFSKKNVENLVKEK